MEAEYLQSAMPDPVVCLGQILKPFSLGHKKILLRHDNAFARGAEPALGDLVFAVFVCSQTYKECMESLTHGVQLQQSWLRRFLRIEPKRIRADKWLYEWGRLFKKVDVGKEMEVFLEYVKNGSLRAREREMATGRILGTPFIQAVQIVLQGRLGHSLEDALDKPWGEAMQDYQAFWEMEGKVQLFNAEDEEHLKAVQQLEAEILKEQGEPCQN